MLIKGGRLANSIILYWQWLLAVRLTFVARPSSTSGTCIFLDTNQSGLTMKLPATPMVGRGSKPVKSGLYATLDEPPPPLQDDTALANASPTSEASVVSRTWTRGPLSDGEGQPQCKWLAGDVGWCRHGAFSAMEGGRLIEGKQGMPRVR